MPNPSTQPTFSPPQPQRHRLANGLQLLVEPKRELPVVSLGLILRSGAIADPRDQPGLTYLTTELLQEGTASRTSQQIASDLEFIGAHLNLRSERELTLLATSTLTKHWGRALELLGDLVMHPSFPDEEWVRVRKEHLADLARARDDAARIAERLYAGLLFGSTSPYGHPVEGTEPSVTEMGRKHLVEHHEAHWDPREITLLVAGDVRVEEVVAKAEAVLGAWTTKSRGSAPFSALPNAAASRPTTLYVADKPGAPQSVIRAGHPSVSRQHPDYYPLMVMNYAFGGHFAARLNMNLRQNKGYSYGYRSFFAWMRNLSYFVAGGAVQTRVTKESVEETLREFSDLHGARPLTQAELDGARNGLLRGFPSTFETTDLILEHLVDLVHFDLPNDYFTTLRDRVGGVSLGEVHRVASKHLTPHAMTLLVVGDRQNIEPGLRELGVPLVSLDLEGRELKDSPL